MDAHNLAVCFTPTLVKSSNVLNDVQMCSVPGGPTLYSQATKLPNQPPAPKQTTAGMVIKFCIQRYFEIFEEVIDRSEPLHSPGGVLAQQDYDGPSSSPFGIGADEEESLDDAMLVMPLGPTSPTSSSPYAAARSPPTAWRHKHRRMGSGTSGSSGPPAPPSKPGSLRSKTRDSPMGTMTGSRSRRSLASIEKTVLNGGGRGTITIGKSTARRAGGAGVEAVSVTALGFFSPPSQDESSTTTTSTSTNSAPGAGSSAASSDGDSTSGHSASERRRKQLSEVAE